MIRLTLCLACLGGTLAAGEDNAWQTQRTEPILIKTRALPGSAVREVWAEGTLEATPIDLQQAITDVERFTAFMPYLTESRLVGGADPDGARYHYVRFDAPVLAPRDFVHKMYLDRDAAQDPEGVFENHWFAVPTRVPERPGVVRLKISEGSWRVTPLPDGKRSFVIYRMRLDPGGAVPAFAANQANTNGLTETFQNLEREAQRWAAERAASSPSPAP